MKETTIARYGDPDFPRAYGVAWSSRDEKLFASFFSEEAIYVEGGAHLTFTGITEVVRFFKFMFAFAPDSQIVFTRLTGDRRSFSAEWTWSGTASGKLLLDGILYPATNRPFSVQGVAFCTVNDAGLVTYHKDYYDTRTLLKQLGVFSL
ncbi:MAG: ester cyclase [Candidatus Binatia bacterium]